MPDISHLALPSTLLLQPLSTCQFLTTFHLICLIQTPVLEARHVPIVLLASGTNSSLQTWWCSMKLPEVMQWHDSDPPSKDINVAWLRAKYYEAKSPTTAPSITTSHSQQVSPSMTDSQQVTSTARLHENPGPVQSSTTAPVGRRTSYTYRDLPTKLQQACKLHSFGHSEYRGIWWH